MRGQRWEVVGGSDRGGIVVRTGCDLTSPQASERLSTSALVEELERQGDRLHYRRLTGTGPSEGWVSLKLKDKALLEPRSAEGANSAQPPKAKPAPGPKAVPAPKAKTVETPAPKAEPEEAPNGHINTGNGYEARLAALQERYAHLELKVPYDAYMWTPEELENFFESDGFIKPVRSSKKETAPEQKPNRERKDSLPDVPQFSNAEARKLQDQLKGGFSNKDFQQSLKTLQSSLPNRKTKGHPDSAAYIEAFQALTMSVYCHVLPKWGLTGDWSGVNDMFAKMQSALSDRTVKKQMEEINTLLGLPRDAVFKPSKKVEMFVFCPEGNAPSVVFPRQFIQDDDGDEAHEFLVEDPVTGVLRRVGSSALDD